ncbi:MAG TPA: phenylacetic acid degradation operon negative regulatory protein PaaX [Woeseiaceae bacterium]|nr:phenylacetic acid degradation operon negative regulatory protein PaaX [Woeseiaceae bacterium]
MSALETATQSLIEEFRGRPTLRAGSLIITVFGDAIAPRGGTVWIGSLIRALADFGISERLVRTSVFRLAKDGWLDVDQVGRRSYYHLTEEGANRFAQATHRIYGEPRQSWPGDWCLVLTAALDAARRDRVRRELGWLGFAAIANDVLAHPSPDAADLDAELKRLDASEELIVMQARTDGPWCASLPAGGVRALVRRSWNLDDIEHRYQAFLDRFRPLIAACRRSRRIAPRTAFHVRTLLVQEYRKVLLRDPLLPAELLPRTWHGVPAYQLCRNLYRQVFAAADEYLGKTMETADGPLPPPSPEFYRRFGGLDT